MTWRIHPSQEHNFFGLRPREATLAENTQLRAETLSALVVCEQGHVTGTRPGEWCIRELCRSTATVSLAYYPAIIAYMLLSEATEAHWEDKDVFQMARELGAWPR